MSINFQDEVDDEVKKKLFEMFGAPVVDDKKTFLYDKLETINQKLMKEIANKAKQPVEVELNSEGDVKTMSDGTRYVCSKDGWKRE